MLVSGSVGTSWNLKNNHPLKINGWLSNGMMNQIVNIGNGSLTSSFLWIGSNPDFVCFRHVTSQYMPFKTTVA